MFLKCSKFDVGLFLGSDIYCKENPSKVKKRSFGSFSLGTMSFGSRDKLRPQTEIALRIAVDTLEHRAVPEPQEQSPSAAA